MRPASDQSSLPQPAADASAATPSSVGWVHRLRPSHWRGLHARRQHARSARTARKYSEPRALITLGDMLLFLLGFPLFPIWLAASALLALAPLLEALGKLVLALVAVLLWLGDALFFRLRHKKRIGATLRRNWSSTGAALWRALAQAVRPWGLGHLVRSIGYQVDELSGRYAAIASRASDPEHTPEDFREQYHRIGELPSGGSSARIYIVRRVDGDPRELFVLKYFNIATGANLDSVVRETQAVELAKRLHLIVDSHIGERSFYYVMPYYVGDTLTRRVVDSVRALAPEAEAPAEYQRMALGWIHQLLQLIAQYHEAGVFHKDIKPDNLIVNGENLYLVDIGLLTPLESVQQLTTHGTEYFRDPEMVRLALEGMQVRDVKASKFDIYAIGAVLYFLFEGDFPAAASLSRFVRPVPRAVQMVVSRAMAPMEQRYDSARTMLADIDFLCRVAAQRKLETVAVTELPSLRAVPGSRASEDEATQPAYLPPRYARGVLAKAAANLAPSELSQPVLAQPRLHDRSDGWRRWAFFLALFGALTVVGVFAVGAMFDYYNARAQKSAGWSANLQRHLEAVEDKRTRDILRQWMEQRALGRGEDLGDRSIPRREAAAVIAASVKGLATRMSRDSIPHAIVLVGAPELQTRDIELAESLHAAFLREGMLAPESNVAGLEVEGLLAAGLSADEVTQLVFEHWVEQAATKGHSAPFPVICLVSADATVTLLHPVARGSWTVR